jgi:hypothetical protein
MAIAPVGEDIVLGAATVILTMGQGRIAAAINKYLAEKNNSLISIDKAGMQLIS